LTVLRSGLIYGIVYKLKEYLSMAMKCESCGKGILYGHNVSHSKRRTLRKFRPNLHSARIVIDGTAKKMKLCTKCLRMYKRVATAQNVLSAKESSAQFSV